MIMVMIIMFVMIIVMINDKGDSYDHGHDNENHGDHDDDCGRGDSSAPTGRLGKAWNAKLQLRPFCAIQQFNTVAWTVFMINCYCKTMQCYHR